MMKHAHTLALHKTNKYSPTHTHSFDFISACGRHLHGLSDSAHTTLLTCASLCWLSASPGETSACLASSMSSAEPSITSRAESSMAAAALGSVVEAATPRAACARVFRAWAVSLAAIPAPGIQMQTEQRVRKFKKKTSGGLSLFFNYFEEVLASAAPNLCNVHFLVQHR